MKPVGYAALIDRYDLKGPRPWHLSAIAKGPRRCTGAEDGLRETFPPSYAPGPADLDHLVFALTYDGTDLGFLRSFFTIFTEGELVEALAVKSHSMPLRRLWFLFEWLTRGSLPVKDMKTGNYGALLDPDAYVTAPLFRSPRQRILVNALGTSRFCPIIRRTERLRAFAGKELQHRTGTLISTVDASVLARATSYLYLKESRTSWEIERVPPSQQRMLRFLNVLRQAPSAELDKPGLIRAHNSIVDPDYFETNYRIQPVFVADGARIDYIAPRPEDVPELMEGLLGGVDHGGASDAVVAADIAAMNGGAGRGEVLRDAMTIDPVVHAALVGFAFVYIHPFADGNGRTHRYLVQQIFARRSFAPPTFIVPVSPAILRDRDGYLATLGGWSSTIMPFVDYVQNQRFGTIAITNQTIDLYRHPDLTAHAEFLYEKIEESIERDVQSELVYIQTYDRALLRARLIRRLPDEQERALLQLCFSEGTVTPEARRRVFPEVPAADLDALIAIVVETLEQTPLPRAFLQAQALDQPR